MMDEAEADAADRWAKMKAATKGLEIPEETWAQLRDRFEEEKGDDGISEAREFYHSQPWVKAIEQADLCGPFTDPIKEFGASQTAYLQRARQRGISTFAIIKDGKWFEKGQMGWWGLVHDEMEQDVWHNQFELMLHTLPDDTLLSVYDCHI